MSLKIYFLRHGETPYSRTGGYCGELDPDLTTEGADMAIAFANAYKTMAWDAIYVSPMKRTIATATPLCETMACSMRLRDGLKEIRYGQWEGKTSAEVRHQYAEEYISWMTEPAWNAPTGGETAQEVANRALAVVAEIQQQVKAGNVLVVSHKATIRIMLCSLLGIDLGRYRDRINALVASVSIVKFETYGPMLEVLGDRNHLPEALRHRPGT